VSRRWPAGCFVTRRPSVSMETYMLVLTRKKGQRIRIGSTVEITVLEVRGGSVKLGFEAPANITIHRDEITSRFPAYGNPAVSSMQPAEVEAGY
jgi:carbon storage regulator